MPADTLITVIAAAAAAVVLAVALNASAGNARRGLAVLVGITGGLQKAQVAGTVHVFCFAVAGWLLLGVLREGRRPPRWGVALLPPVCAGTLASTVLTGSLVNNPAIGVQLMVLATTAGLFVAFADEADVRAALQGLLLVTTFGSLVGILQYAGFLPHIHWAGEDRPVGIYSEPDWLGLFSAIGLFLAFFVRRPALRYAAAAVNVVGVLLAAARAGWIALLVVGVIGVLLARAAPTDQRPRGGWRLATAGAAVAGVVFAVRPDLMTYLAGRLQGLSASDPDVSARARQQQFDALAHLEAIAPWHGLGLSASGRVEVSGGITYLGPAANNVASNWLVGWWVDGKYLAVPLILLFVTATVAAARRISGRLLLLVLVNSLFSNALYFPIAWMALGACLVARRERVRAGDGDPRCGLSPGHDAGTRETVRGAAARGTT